MSDWSLPELLSALHDNVQHQLGTASRTLVHAPAKGDASESIWLKLLDRYLPRRYRATSAHVVDSKGEFSEQIDVVVFDRQYSPLIFEYQGQTIIPAESIYAVFEAKQTVDASKIKYAQKKVGSVRRLHRTSLPIPHAGGVYPPKPLPNILGGVLALRSDWTPALGNPLRKVLLREVGDGRLDIGCIASEGIFALERDGSYAWFSEEPKSATAFLFELIARLQVQATVPMIDVRAYAKWLR